MPEAHRQTPSPRAYALAARRAARRVPGVARLDGCACEWLVGGVPGVAVRVGERERLSVEVFVIAQLGQRVDLLGRAVQDAVAAAFKEIPGRRAVAIDIIISGIRYDKRALPKRKEYTR